VWMGELVDRCKCMGKLEHHGNRSVRRAKVHVNVLGIVENVNNVNNLK
jgi:hypothetical protein